MEKLLDIPYEAAVEYERSQDMLVTEVNRQLSARGDINKLIGSNSLEVMENNHSNHAKFMVNIFKFQQSHLLLQTLPWVYRSYRARGFSYDYFTVVLEAWLSAVEKYMEPHLAEPLAKVYRWLLDNHEKIIQFSQQITEPGAVEVKGSWEKEYDSFLQCLLQGEHRNCLKLANENVNSYNELKDFYLQVVQPALYQIGFMWEKGEISVAHEHLASAIISRVMANQYPRFILGEHTKGTAVVTASPNEFHEIGARMVADFLEIDGWDVKYLGASVPEDELIEILEEEPPILLGISAAMPFNIDRVSSIVDKVRNTEKLQNIKIMVGGKVFSENPGLWEVTEADAFAANAEEAVTLALKLWKEG